MLTLNATSTAATVTGSILTTTDANLTTADAGSGGQLGIARGQIVQGGTLPAGTYVASLLSATGGTHTWQLANGNAAIPNQSAFTAQFYSSDAGLLPLSARN